MATLLVIEDDINTNEAICEYMKSAGHTTLSALDGEEGLLLAKEPSVDLVVLDIMLPKIDGMTVLRELRKCSAVPVLMLTAIEDEHTQATSFDAEADDYITNAIFYGFVRKANHSFAPSQRKKSRDTKGTVWRYYRRFWRLRSMESSWSN